MEGKFEGASYISVSFDSEEKLEQYIKENNIKFITDDEYKQITKRKQTSEFYTLKYFK